MSCKKNKSVSFKAVSFGLLASLFVYAASMAQGKVVDYYGGGHW